jgi:hypothetical protein
MGKSDHSTDTFSCSCGQGMTASVPMEVDAGSGVHTYEPIIQGRFYEAPDTRYKNGVIEAYANRMAELRNTTAMEWYDRCKKYVDANYKWHEENRHYFQFKEGYEAEIDNSRFREVIAGLDKVRTYYSQFDNGDALADIPTNTAKMDLIAAGIDLIRDTRMVLKYTMEYVERQKQKGLTEESRRDVQKLVTRINALDM